jgi:hypothetical protein
MVKQIVIVLNYNGAKITEQNIKDILGPRWAWKMAKLFPAVAFIDGDQQRECWWRVTEITLDHLRPSPKWNKEMADLQLAKDCEALIERGLKELAKRRKQDAEKHRMLREVLEDLAVSSPLPF